MSKPEQLVLGLPTKKVAAIVGVAPSTLNYWVQLGLVTPSLRRPQGHRAQQWWTVEDVVIVQTVSALRRAGVSLKKLKAVARHLVAAGVKISSVRLIWDGRDVVLVDENGGFESAFAEPGQRMIQVHGLPLGTWHRVAEASAEEVDQLELDRLTKNLANARRRREAAIQRLRQPTAGADARAADTALGSTPASRRPAG